MNTPIPVPVPTPIQGPGLGHHKDYLQFKDNSFYKVVYPVACHKDGGVLNSDNSIIYTCENIISSNAPMKHQSQVSLDFIIGMGLVGLAVLALIYSLINYLFRKK